MVNQLSCLALQLPYFNTIFSPCFQRVYMKSVDRFQFTINNDFVKKKQILRTIVTYNGDYGEILLKSQIVISIT